MENMSITPKNPLLSYPNSSSEALIERDLESSKDEGLKLAILADKYFSKKRYIPACQEIGKMKDMALKKFYTMELMDHLMASNEAQADVIARSMAPSDLKDKYLAELGRHYLNGKNSSAATVVVTAMREGLVKTNLLVEINELHTTEDKVKIRLLNQSWTRPETINHKLADEDIGTIHNPSSQDDLRARLGEILMRNGKSSEALNIIQKMSDPIKKDEARASLVDIALEENKLQKALFFLSLITHPITRFNINEKKDELLAKIIDEYLSVSDISEAVQYLDQIKNTDLKKTITAKILAASNLT